jgi:hypothetical protein
LECPEELKEKIKKENKIINEEAFCSRKLSWKKDVIIF